MTDRPPENGTDSAAGPTCYIHVGPHKTGSSSLKHFFRDNRVALGGFGLFFPMLRDEAGRPARNHMELATSGEIRADGELKGKARLWPEIDAVAREGKRNILLSSEMFCRSLTDDEAFERILTFFETRGYRVRILAYVRDQPAWLNSWYVQNQKRFSSAMSFDEFVEEADRRGRVEPERYLKHFIEQPRCALEIIPFERAAAAGLEMDFVARCGVPAEAQLVKSSIRNPNAGAKSIFAAQEVLRRTGEGLQDLPGFIGVCSGFRERFTAYGWDGTPYVALTEDNVARIRARYAPSNERFAQAHFGVTWAELCPPKRFRTSLFDPAQASWWERRKIERLVRGTVRQFEALRAAAGQGDRRAKSG